MICIGANGTFRCITPVYVWWYQLIFRLCFLEHVLCVVGTFIVENVDFWCFIMSLELFICRFTYLAYVRRIMTFDCDTLYGISVIMVKYNNVFVAPRGCDGKLPSLV